MVRPRSRALAVYVVALACLTGACSSGTDARASAPTTTKPAAPPTALNCRDFVGRQGALSSGYSAVLDRVGLPTGTKLQAVRLGARGKYWAKSGLLIRPGAKFELIVPAAWVGKLEISWGKPGKATTHLVVTGCRASDPATRWLAFAGGFTVSRPACVPLLVKAGMKQQLVHIAVGAACALRERGSR